jgi:gliding motility-associated-like protein
MSVPKSLLALLVLGVFSLAAPAQTPGTWTWMGGDSTLNSMGSFGTLRVPDPANKPPGRYEAGFWTDLEGNFWLLGGYDTEGIHNDLWKYDVSSGLWTWMHGSPLADQFGTYGTQGLPNATNCPGARSYGVVTWTGTDGNLWLFGGNGFAASGFTQVLGDLWKFDVVTLEWTWMKGPSGIAPGSYGVLGVPSPSNYPRGRCEVTASWVDNAGNLWLYGGQYTSGNLSDMWKYDPTTNEWTWMQGISTLSAAPAYGTLGVESPANSPGARWTYGEWRDKSGRFYLLGGKANATTGSLNDLWRYNPVTNAWAWIGGPSTINDPGGHGADCLPSASNWPSARTEHSSQWVDSCGGFWMFGGSSFTPPVAMSDLWYYHPDSGAFIFLNGSNTSTLPTHYGTMGVSSPLNTPGGRDGACAWADSAGRLWLFGGEGILPTSVGLRNDLWVYTPDPACTPPSSPRAVAAMEIDSSAYCEGDFTFHQTGVGTTFFWDFGDGYTISSPDPGHSYASPGTYTVTLITFGGCSGNTPDTTTATVTVPALPFSQLPADTLLCPAATLLLDPDPTGMNPGATYSWSTGSTSQQVTAEAAGNYSVTVTSTEGCTSTASAVVEYLPEVDLGDEVHFCEGEKVRLDAGHPGAVYLWNTGETSSSILSGDEGLIWVLVTDHECLLRDTVELISEGDGSRMYFPNSFTPNGDGLNDAFGGTGECTGYQLMIYDRTGKLIFESNSVANKWDGKVQGQQAPEGVYAWSLQYTSVCTGDAVLESNGSVTLLR